MSADSRTAMVLMLAAALLCTAAALALASANRGAAELILPGGSRGVVPFPHQRHQETLGLENCQTCHELFAQQPGVIAQRKADKTLKPKQVMNRLCVRCHRGNKKAGLATGPVNCAKCHQR